MVKTPLYQKSMEHNPRIVDFFGWALPLEYKSILSEVKHARDFCVLFDVSHMGRLIIKGGKRIDFLNRLVANDPSLLAPWRLQYNLFTSPHGTIIDDFMLYNRGDSLICVVNASNREKVISWLNQNNSQGVEIIDDTYNSALISLQGPESASIMEHILGYPLRGMKYMSFRTAEVAGMEFMFSRSGYTGEDGFELYIPEKSAFPFWDLLMETGQKFNLSLAGLGARDILRIEAGYPLYGQELDEQTGPVEAGLRWVVKLKDRQFWGKEEICRSLEELPGRERIGFILEEKGVPRSGYKIYNSEDGIIGRVSSGTYSPCLDRFLGMGYIDSAYKGEGSVIKINIRDRLFQAKVVALPFIPYKHK